MAGKPISMTLEIDTSIMVAQTKIIAEVLESFEPLLAKASQEIVENIISNFVVKLKDILFGYYVATLLADGTSKTVRVIRYRGDIKSFTTAFWTREIHLLH